MPKPELTGSPRSWAIMRLFGRLYPDGIILTPLVLTRKALRLMDTDQLPALGTCPSFLFVSNEMSYAELPYIHEIVNHAHAIFGSIARIQATEPVARKAVAAEAIPGFILPYLLAVLDSARDAGFCFAPVVASTTGARLVLSCICSTEATVHSTGSNQRGSHRMGLCRSGLQRLASRFCLEAQRGHQREAALWPRRAIPCSRLVRLVIIREALVSETTYDMIVYPVNGLHERITNCRMPPNPCPIRRVPRAGIEPARSMPGAGF
jgi:hypothetical protein